MAKHRRIFGSLSLTALAITAGCATAANDEIKPPTTQPHLLALSTYSASLGTPIEAYFANPPPSTARKIELVFDGSFTRSDGKSEPVTLAQEMDRSEAGAARWTSFGPFQNPFTPQNPDVGVFKGKVGVRVTNADGSTSMDEAPLPMQFEVKPSIIITELQPTTAECSKPALRLIGAMSYKLKATTIGFRATSIEYSFQTPGVVPDQFGAPALDTSTDGTPQYRMTKLSHPMKGDVDTVDGKEALVLPPVPKDRPSYGVVFAIVARDDKGHSVASTFGMTAHNPIQIVNDGRFQLAQIYPAKPVSGCTPGGQQGRNVDYSEAQTETRQRQLSITLSKNWLKSDENNWSTSDGKTITQSKTVTDGYSKTHGVTNTFSFERSHSDTKGVSFNWQDSKAAMKGGAFTAGGGGSATIPVVGGLGVNAKAENRWDHSNTNTSSRGGSREQSSTNGWSSGQSNSTLDQSTVDHSTATTDSTAVTKTESKGGSSSQAQGGATDQNQSWTVSSSETIQRGFSGSVVAGTYGVFYRQLARYTERAFVVVYNKCGEGDVIGDLTLQDYVWAPDLALGAACPPLPVSNFPQPQCYLPPCDQ